MLARSDVSDSPKIRKNRNKLKDIAEKLGNDKSGKSDKREGSFKLQKGNTITR